MALPVVGAAEHPRLGHRRQIEFFLYRLTEIVANLIPGHTSRKCRGMSWAIPSGMMLRVESVRNSRTGHKLDK